MQASPLTTHATRRLLVAAGIFLVVAASIALTARDPGLTWDEAIYLGRALRFVDWFQNLSARSFTWQAISEHWWSADHPPLGSLWIALNMRLFTGPVDLLSAARLGAGILFGGAAAALYLWVAPKRGERGGVVAATVFVLMPRIFAHGHFANLEMATLLLWLLTVIAFERGIERRGWSAACGVLFGLALLTKINAVFLPMVLLPWGFLFHGRKALRNAISMAVVGPLIVLAGWPVMWYHPAGALRAYFDEKLHRMILPVYYLGTAYGEEHPEHIAPWHYPFVLLLATTPLPVLAALGSGLWKCAQKIRRRWRESADEALLIWAFLFPVCLLALPGIPKYDGIRLMLPAYPFLAGLAAVGAVSAWDWARARIKRTRLGLRLLGGVFAAWLLIPVVALHPYQLCYYSELVGGPWGARSLGFETTYWDDTFDGKAVACLNENVPKGGTVAFVAMGDYIWNNYYQEMLGEARADIRMGEFEKNDWDYLVVVPRQGWWTAKERQFIESPDHRPFWVNRLPPVGQLPICMIYKRPDS